MIIAYLINSFFESKRHYVQANEAFIRRDGTQTM